MYFNNVGLVQINNSFSGQSYLPYSVALLQGYFQKHSASSQEFNFELPIFQRLKIGDAVERLEKTSVVFFSTYVWNFRISCEIAKALKDKKPDIVTVFGGPHVPNLAEEFIEKHPFIDISVHGEGERTAMLILENLLSRNWDNVPGISFLSANGQFRHNLRGDKILCLDDIPSPYADGILEPLLKEYPNQKWIASWETNRGCPFSCTYCDWGSATQSKVYQFGMERLFREIDWFAEKEIEFIFCCDANYGILARDLDITEYVAEVKLKTGFPKALSVQNTKNATERAYKVQKMLSDAGLNKGVTLAIQSMDIQTLKNIKRQNISLESYHELQRRFTKDRVETYSDYILGLPGETYEATVDGICTLIENGQHNRIQFNNLSILPNAEMADPEYRRKFGLVAVESDIINIHGSMDDADNEILEKQLIVIATRAMPKQDWARVRAFCWMTAFLYFDKVLQIPIMVARAAANVSYRTILDGFIAVTPEKYPVLNGIVSFFIQQAQNIQSGGPEYFLSEDHLDIFWPHDEFILIKLVHENNLDSFYDEARSALHEICKGGNSVIQPLISDAIRLNHALLKLPFQTGNLEIQLDYNILKFYQAARLGQCIPIEEQKNTVLIDRTTVKWNTWDEYCREVIWYGNKKGAYLYSDMVVTPQIAGIF